MRIVMKFALHRATRYTRVGAVRVSFEAVAPVPWAEREMVCLTRAVALGRRGRDGSDGFRGGLNTAC